MAACEASAIVLALVFVGLGCEVDWLPDPRYDDWSVYVLAILGLAARRHARSGRLRAVVTDAAGLTLETADDQADRRIAWSDLQSVECRTGCWLLHTIHGPAAITSSLIDRDGLLAELTSHARCAAPEVWSRSRLAWLLQTVWQAALIGGTLVAVSRLTRWFYRHLDYHHVLVIPVWVRGRHTSDDGWWCEFGASVVGMSYALGLLLALQAMLLCAAARRWVRRVELTDHGVRSVLLNGQATVLPWSDVLGASWSWRGLWVATVHGPVWYGVGLRDGRTLAARIGERASGSGDEADVFDRTAAATWLDRSMPFALLGLGQLAVMGVFITDYHLMSWPFALLGALAAGAWLVAGRWRVRRLSAGPEALRIAWAVGEPQLIPWSGVRSIQRTASGWYLTTSQGAVTIASSLQRPQELLALARQQIERHRPPNEVAEVEAPEIEGWLQIPADQVLRVRPWRLSKLVAGGIVWLAIAAGLIPWMVRLAATEPWLPHSPEASPHYLALFSLAWMASPLWLFWLVYYPVRLALVWRAEALREVQASAHGLRWRTGRYWSDAGWDEVTASSLVPRENRAALFYWTTGQMLADQEVLVDCGGLTFRFSPRDDQAPKLQAALDRLLAARRQGRTLPGTAAISPRSLSRATPAAADASRGLSRSNR